MRLIINTLGFVAGFSSSLLPLAQRFGPRGPNFPASCLTPAPRWTFVIAFGLNYLGVLKIGFSIGVVV